MPLAAGLKPGEKTEGLSLVSATLSCPEVKLCEAKSILLAIVFSKASGEPWLLAGESIFRTKTGVSCREPRLRM